MSYLKLNGVNFDVKVAISAYERHFDVLDGEGTGRVKTGGMVRDIIGTYIGHNITVFRRGDNHQGLDELWDYLIAHSTDKRGVLLEAADGQSTITYRAYYTSGSQPIEKVEKGVNYWGEMTINFIPMEPQKRA